MNRYSIIEKTYMLLDCYNIWNW